MPIKPRATSPLFFSCAIIPSAILIGMANPIPWPLAMIAVLIPTTSPFRLRSGPPLFPGLMEASVCIKSSYGPEPRMRPLALTIPAVTVCSSPKGLPMATTHVPTFRSSELPILRGTKSEDSSILIRAKSVLGSRPTIFASNSFSLASLTLIWSAFSTT